MAEPEGLDPMADLGATGPTGQAGSGAGSAGTTALEERIRALEEELRRLRGGRDHDRDRGRQPESVFDRLVPAEARRHLRAAQRERLLAVRAFVDAAIKRTEEGPEGRGPEGRGGREGREGRPRRPESVRID